MTKRRARMKNKIRRRNAGKIFSYLVTKFSLLAVPPLLKCGPVQLANQTAICVIPSSCDDSGSKFLH